MKMYDRSREISEDGNEEVVVMNTPEDVDQGFETEQNALRAAKLSEMSFDQLQSYCFSLTRQITAEIALHNSDYRVKVNQMNGYLGEAVLVGLGRDKKLLLEAYPENKIASLSIDERKEFEADLKDIEESITSMRNSVERTVQIAATRKQMRSIEAARKFVADNNIPYDYEFKFKQDDEMLGETFIFNNTKGLVCLSNPSYDTGALQEIMLYGVKNYIGPMEEADREVWEKLQSSLQQLKA